MEPVMSPVFSPQQACKVVTEATGYHLEPQMLRTWRNRGLRLSFEQEGEGWTRYSVIDVFAMAVMAHGIRAGYTPRTAANIARIARDYAPGTSGSDASGMYLVLPGITSDDEEGEAGFMHRFKMHERDLHKLHSDDDYRAKVGDCLHILVPLSRIREAVLAAVAGTDAA
jgi:hypothetical protein